MVLIQETNKDCFISYDGKIGNSQILGCVNTKTRKKRLCSNLRKLKTMLHTKSPSEGYYLFNLLVLMGREMSNSLCKNIIAN